MFPTYVTENKGLLGIVAVLRIKRRRLEAGRPSYWCRMHNNKDRHTECKDEVRFAMANALTQS